VKLLDFGLGQGLDARLGKFLPGSSSTITIGTRVGGVILGTPAYISPEQAKGIPVDRRADIWAFGAVLYEMVCGGLSSRARLLRSCLQMSLQARRI